MEKLAKTKRRSYRNLMCASTILLRQRNIDHVYHKYFKRAKNV